MTASSQVEWGPSWNRLNLVLTVSWRVSLPSSVGKRKHRSVSPIEKGINASVFFRAPLASRKWSGLKASGCSKYRGSWRAELRMGYTSVF